MHASELCPLRVSADVANYSHRTIVKFLDYFDNFSRFKQIDTVNSLSSLMEAQPNLSQAEKAQLATLNCESAEEARTLIPSLANSIDDDTLQNLLDDMQKLLRQF